MRATITESAWEDMLGVCRAIGLDSPRRAESFLEELYKHCVELADMPAAFPFASGYEAQGIRRRVFGNYLVFYRINAKTVEVLHVIHGARDYDRILSSET
jgi:plasmid stabilization system protein ParE